MAERAQRITLERVADLRIEDLKKRNVLKSNAVNRFEYNLPVVIARAQQGEVGQTEALLRYVFYIVKFGSKRNPPDLQAVLFLAELELDLSPEKRQRFLHLRSLPKRAEILTPRCPRGRPRTEDQEEQEIVAALLREQAMVNHQVPRPRLRGDLSRHQEADNAISKELHKASRSIRRYHSKYRSLIGKLRKLGINLGVEKGADGKSSLTIKPFKSLEWFKKLPGKTRRL